MPLVSIVVPVYKVEQHLAQCIDSLLAQTISDIELILVDDGSPDNCGAICDRYAACHPNIKVIHKENQGQTPARKDGLKAATGKYIAFADSDDWVDPDMYERMLKTLEENHADMVITGYKQEFPQSTQQHANRVPSGVYTGEALETLRQLSVFSTEHGLPAISISLWTKLFRKDYIEDTFLSIPGQLRIGEDALCTWSLLSRAKCVVINNDHAPYHYRTWEGSITQRYYANYPQDLYYLKTALDKLYGGKNPAMDSAIANYFIDSLLHGALLECSRLNPAGFLQKVSGLRRFCPGEPLQKALKQADLSRIPSQDRTKLQLLKIRAPFLFLLYHKCCNLLARLRK